MKDIDFRPYLFFVGIVWIFIFSFKGDALFEGFNDVSEPDGFLSTLDFVKDILVGSVQFLYAFLFFAIDGIPLLFQLLFVLLVNVPMIIGLIQLGARFF